MTARLIVAGVLCLLVSGCQTVSPQEVRAGDRAACRDYGFKPGTTAFAECLQRRDLAREADYRARLYSRGPYLGVGGGFIGGRYGALGF